MPAHESGQPSGAADDEIARRAARRRDEAASGPLTDRPGVHTGTPLYDALADAGAQDEPEEPVRGGRHGDDDGDGVANQADPEWADEPDTEALDLAAFTPRGASAGHLDAEALATLMGRVLPIARYEAMLPGYIAAMRAAGVAESERRACQWHAQLGHESVGLRYMAEIWGPSAQQRKYDPASGTSLARQLGNTEPGDGYRYRGGGPIQITGRGNFAKVSAFAHDRGLVPTRTYLVDNPDELRSDRLGFIGAIWYWTVARPDINTLADREDTTTVTKRINGGTTGLADRQARYAAARRLGSRVLPAPGAGTAPAARTATREVEMLDRPLVPGRNVGTIIVPVGKASGPWGIAEGVASVRADGGATVNLWWQTSADTPKDPPGAGKAIERVILAHSRRGWWPIPDGTEYIQYDITTGGAGAICLELRPK